MKVLVLATTFPRWHGDATASFVLELCRGLAAKGHEMIVLAPHHEGAALTEEAHGVKIHRFPYFCPRNYQRLCYGGGILPNLRRSPFLWLQVPLLFLSQLFFAVKLIKRERIDVVHSHWVIPSGIIGAICKKLFGCFFVITLHGSGDIAPMRIGWLRPFIKRALMSCDACTANSGATVTTVKRITGLQRAISVIPMGVGTILFNPVEGNAVDSPQIQYGNNGPVILSVGRLIDWKGLEYLLQAMPMVLGRFPGAKLVICGDGPERNDLEEMTGELELGEYVVFEGSVPNHRLPHYYRSASVFVLPSIILESTGETEGLGVVLLEAMACGTPVIGSNVGGVSDVIEDGWNGFLVRQKNPHEIAAKIVELLDSDHLRRKFSENGLRTVEERFSWDVVVDRFDEIFRPGGKRYHF